MYLFAKFNIPFFVFLVKLTKFINFIPKIHELILVRFPPPKIFLSDSFLQLFSGFMATKKISTHDSDSYVKIFLIVLSFYKIFYNIIPAHFPEILHC